MAESLAKLGFGALLQAGDGASPEVFTTIAEIFELDPIGETTGLVQVTHHESPGKRHEYILGLADGDEFGFRANYLPTNATQDQTTGIIKKAQDKTKHNFKLVAPDADVTLAFDALVLHWDINFQLADKQILSGRLKITGPVTLT